MDFAAFSAIVEETGVAASEVHGLLAGFLCAGGIWEDAADEELEILLPNIDGRVVRGLLDEVHGALGLMTMEFTPLIPDDECEVADRLSGLAVWCGGFLAGYGLGVGDSRLTPETEEVLTDLQAIAELDDAADDADDEVEHEFVEVYEYVRVAALSLFGVLPMMGRNSDGDDA